MGSQGARVWYFRVIETGAGQWACRHGRLVLDTHPELEQAIEHITTVATANRPAQLLLHHLDGTITDLGIV